MWFSVNYRSQQHRVMQEAIGMGNLQSKEHLPFKGRTMLKECYFEQLS